MESTDSSSGSQQPNLPPGFRFHPTDEELVVHYLKKKASSSPLPVAIIAEVDLYKFDPWELPGPTSGYWKATGTDKPVLTSGGTQKVGVKKALVFYGGKPPKGIKTNWIMHEYRLADKKLDDWVLCRIYKKNNTLRPMDHDKDDSVEDMLGSIPPSISVGTQQNTKLQLVNGPNYEALVENEQNFFNAMLSNDGINNTNFFSQLASSTSRPAELSMLPLKRTHPSLYWSDDDAGGPPSSKRFQGDNGDGSVVRTDGNGSIASLLSQLPQTPPLHQQTMLGSMGDGIFRPPYQLSNLNWYS
ncbi:hypothetical protein GH714_009311 [Hevea brasiliensis]|uniref:NAC domain-containing protein n=1 Tax=Hevea brasiliensis TaxID=3981 RepID=A0A6A6KDI3_HEVBR|nr:hypothetical protein GH714_009311 [Hevea brasiliensis]